jgi:hypothetical protein
VTDGPTGFFYSAYQALGGKGVLGDPLSRVTGSGTGRREQFFDGVVLAVRPGSGVAVRALPIVAMLAKDSPAAYRAADLPPLLPPAAAAQRRDWLTSPAIRRAYLDGNVDSPARYAAAVRRYGEPLGPPSTLPGGGVGQAFANLVLEAPGSGGSVHAATVTPAAIAAGLFSVPARAREPQPPPPLPKAFPLGPAEPTSVEPFAATLGATLLLYGGVVATLAHRQRRRQRALAAEPRRAELVS